MVCQRVPTYPIKICYILNFCPYFPDFIYTLHALTSDIEFAIEIKLETIRIETDFILRKILRTYLLTLQSK